MAIAAAPPWWFWRFMLRNFSWLVSLFGRVQVTGEIPEELRRGPLLLAANHIGDFDPFVVAVALHRIGVVPRIMATGGIISAPVVGPLLERTGAIRVERGTELARHAVRVTEVALVYGGHVVAYPEGRVGLTADGWPERGRTGMARHGPGPRRAGDPGQPVGRARGAPVRQRLGQAAHRRPGAGPPARAAGARRTPRAARRPADGPGRRRQPRPLPDRRGDHPRAWCRCAPARPTGRASSTRPGRPPPSPRTPAASSRTTSRDRPRSRSGDDRPSVLDRPPDRLGTCAGDHCAARHRSRARRPARRPCPEAGTLRLVLLRLGHVGLQHLGDDRLPRPVPDAIAEAAADADGRLPPAGHQRRRRAATSPTCSRLSVVLRSSSCRSPARSPTAPAASASCSRASPPSAALATMAMFFVADER